MIEKGVNIEGNIDGTSPLVFSVIWGRLAIEKYLVEKNVNVNSKLEEGNTVLMLNSLSDSDIEITKLIVSKGADINARANNGMTALMLTSQNGNENYIKYLLSVGANINLKNKEGKSACDIATENKYKAMLCK